MKPSASCLNPHNTIISQQIDIECHLPFHKLDIPKISKIPLAVLFKIYQSWLTNHTIDNVSLIYAEIVITKVPKAPLF